MSNPFLCKQEEIEMKQPQDTSDEEQDVVDNAQVPYIDAEEFLFNPVDEQNEPDMVTEKDNARDLVDLFCNKNTHFKEWLTGTRDMSMR